VIKNVNPVGNCRLTSSKGDINVGEFKELDPHEMLIMPMGADLAAP
jgi:hypothetical protein